MRTVDGRHTEGVSSPTFYARWVVFGIENNRNVVTCGRICD